MSSHKRSFQCFNAVGGEGSHKSGTRLPRIPQHGMVGHHEPLEVCCLCSEYRHAQALEALETQVLPLYQTHSLHHHHAHRCVLGRPARPDEAHSGHGRHIHHHRHNKRLILVKNSDPSVRKTIVLHHRSIRSFGLFLEEVSELMQYHIRKLYTPEGRKIDNVPSLIQCPSVLLCVGREPSHPSIVENFRKTSDDKLPRMSGKSRSHGCTEEHEDEGYITRRYQRHAEEPHCTHCYSHCQDYDIWNNIPGMHRAGRCIRTSSSSASSHTMVSRKTVVERQTMSRSSDDHSEQVVETQTVEEAETVEYCTIRSGTCSPKCNVQSSTLDNCDECADASQDEQVKSSEQEERAGSAPSAPHKY
ncbi:unnamed protein product [Pleuronectes platessa]|uniref:Doublecortin domain-containing protein n=1 Tax=Pleuronectes platessa TaxID=8262 RepID=A0A9N7UCE4_PLEPL|nr:unnamed protein product [Pleuronectes platessa]